MLKKAMLALFGRTFERARGAHSSSVLRLLLPSSRSSSLSQLSRTNELKLEADERAVGPARHPTACVAGEGDDVPGRPPRLANGERREVDRLDRAARGDDER